jgi:hypothetical protein
MEGCFLGEKAKMKMDASSGSKDFFARGQNIQLRAVPRKG